ncbi:leucine-rich repeat and IQ domain-containing protein 1 [Drosophila yakuba]|uniref:Uncharacterized protein n=1 Tax=Drosophila yakuba TaxID=7245 RepID=B4P6J8_DROYA|nr:leucine-rich repeat and IQ domain-containing protein 1 [Drosophila yakuba]EDW90950.1 uncharacterized protein Dyak_GE13542 [Drosophila yakuba]
MNRKHHKMSALGSAMHNHKIEPKKYSPQEYREKILSLFPLPPRPANMCHDAFVKKLLEPYVLETKQVVRAVTVTRYSVEEESSEDPNEAFRAKMYKTNYSARASVYMARATLMGTRISTKSILSPAQRDSAAQTTQMFKVRFANLISDFRNVCIIYQLLQLQEILNVMREYPPAGTNPNDTIFGWSCKGNLKRFEQQPSTVYVDILEKNKPEATLDDLKFYVDLGELIGLVQALLDDVIHDRDLCAPNGFMELLKDTQVDIDKLIALPYETIMAEHDSLVEEKEKKNRVGKFHNPKLTAKQRVLNKERFQIDFMNPIETRYKVNWTHDIVEQGQYIDFLRCKVLSDELEKIEELTSKDLSVWRSCHLEYVTLIEQYKNRINRVQQAYDDDMETAENKLQATLNRVSKCKEDLRSYQEKVEDFHLKIEEVRDKIAKEVEKERARLSAARVSKRMSRILARQKEEQKAAAKQAKLDKKLARKNKKAEE